MNNSFGQNNFISNNNQMNNYNNNQMNNSINNFSNFNKNSTIQLNSRQGTIHKTYEKTKYNNVKDKNFSNKPTFITCISKMPDN